MNWWNKWRNRWREGKDRKQNHWRESNNNKNKLRKQKGQLFKWFSKRREAFLKMRKKRDMIGSTSEKKKLDISKKCSDYHWYPSIKNSRAEILCMLYAFHTFIENKNHQHQNREPMSKLSQLHIDNWRLGEMCGLSLKKWSGISEPKQCGKNFQSLQMISSNTKHS